MSTPPRAPASLRHILGGTAWLTAGTFGSQACAALLYICVARAAGPHDFGLIMVAVGVALVACDVVDFGMNLWILAAAGASAEPSEIAAQHQRKVSLAALIALAAISCVAAGQFLEGGSPDQLCLVPLILVGHLATASGVAIAVRMGNPRLASELTFLERFGAALTGLALLGLGVAPALSLVLGMVAGEALSMAWMLARLDLGHPLLRFRLRGLRAQLGRGGAFAASDLASDTIQFHVVIVGALGGAAAAGDYAAATRLTAVFVIATGSLSTVLLPALSRSGAAGPGLFRRSLWILGGTVALGTGVVAALAGPLVRLVYGDEFSGAVPALRLYCLVVLLICVGQPLSAALQSAGRQVLVARAELAAVIPGCLLVGAGARRWGAAGAAAGAAVVLLPVVLSYAAAWRRVARDLSRGRR